MWESKESREEYKVAGKRTDREKRKEIRKNSKINEWRSKRYREQKWERRDMRERKGNGEERREKKLR